MKAKHHIVMVVSNDLVTDRRVARSCASLHEAGYRVTLVGRRFDSAVPPCRPYRVLCLRLLFRRGACYYGELNIRLLWWMLWHRADLYYANDTDTLAACYCAARLRRKAILFDAHELFPEVPELVHRPRVRWVWQRLEDYVLPRIGSRVQGAVVTVSQSIAEHYRQRYGLDVGVVRNVPERCAADSGTMPAVNLHGRRMLLYQGAVNVGRCVDWYIDAMEHLDDCQLVVAGVGDLYDNLLHYAASVPWHERITFLGRLDPASLRALTPRAALGLVLMENLGLNYYYSLPNRIGDFVAADVPVVASDFPELRRVVSAYGIGMLVDVSRPPDSRQLAAQLRAALRWRDSLGPDELRRRFDAASADLSWENDKKNLLESVDTIFQSN
ncbi:MAG: glycosyl transferase group 1 [bacterium P3]|nr:MAG: glycosyl transferase group 1 [bacterium P3]KWW42052.1 MAG: glycosyl transferase group 1 [bacterium F083]